jgi:hypothetical protein
MSSILSTIKMIWPSMNVIKLTIISYSLTKSLVITIWTVLSLNVNSSIASWIWKTIGELSIVQTPTLSNVNITHLKLGNVNVPVNLTVVISTMKLKPSSTLTLMELWPSDMLKPSTVKKFQPLLNSVTKMEIKKWTNVNISIVLSCTKINGEPPTVHGSEMSVVTPHI